jgi:hypothetical protein
MPSYIDKEKAINALRRVCGECKRFYHCSDCRIEESLVALKDLPTADVVEVVRCESCAVPHNKWTGCPKLGGLVPPPDFYCAYGERRDT